MKKGDVVMIDDGSYTRSVVGGKLIEEYLNYGREKGKSYVVIETGCVFPRYDVRDRCRVHGTFNNTVIQAIDSGKVVFIEERFLRLVEPTHKVIVDTVFHSGCGGYGIVGGEVIEISDKLYKEIRKS